MSSGILVVDISHYQPSPDFDELRRAGVVGVIMKCTQGKSYLDPTFKQRYAEAIAGGMPVSSYHFLEAGDPVGQMQWYLKNLNPRQGERVCLDHESTASLPELKQAVSYLHGDSRGLEITIYSGHLIKDQLGSTKDELLATASLWIAHYTSASSPTWPEATWPNWTLWQFTDKARVPGIEGNVDGNRFNGSPENCVKWIGPAATEPAPGPDPDEAVVVSQLHLPSGTPYEIHVNQIVVATGEAD